MIDCRWEFLQLVDSTVFGDGMGSVRHIGAIGPTILKMFDGPISTTAAATIGGRYYECGISGSCDERGIINRPEIQFSRGLEVTITNPKWEQRLSVNSSVGVLSLQGIRDNETKWPLVMSTDGTIREPSTAEKCIVLGGKKWRNAALVTERTGIDTHYGAQPHSCCGRK